MRVQGTATQPLFCALDVCTILGIAQPSTKYALLDDDEIKNCYQSTERGNIKMKFVTEAGMYNIILSCRNSRVKGTIPYKFRRWVTHDILPKLRTEGEYSLKKCIMQENLEEKSRRLWVVVKTLELFSFQIRRKYFSEVCRACKKYTYVDEFNSPHCKPENLEIVKNIIKKLLTSKILSNDQKFITEFFEKM